MKEENYKPPIYERLLSNKYLWVVVIILSAFISSLFEVNTPSRVMGIISLLGLFTCIDRWQEDPKSWAIIFLIGIVLGIEFGGIKIF